MQQMRARTHSLKIRKLSLCELVHSSGSGSSTRSTRNDCGHNMRVVVVAVVVVVRLFSVCWGGWCEGGVNRFAALVNKTALNKLCVSLRFGFEMNAPHLLLSPTLPSNNPLSVCV